MHNNKMTSSKCLKFKRKFQTTKIKDNNEKNLTIPPLTTCPRCNEETYLLMLERKERKKMCRASERKNEAKIKHKKSNSI